MKVCLISKSDVKGGAAKVAFELGRGLRERGHEVTLLADKKSSDAYWVQEMTVLPEREGRLSQKVIHRLGLNALSLNSPFPRCMGSAYFRQFDVIHLHDLPGAFNLLHLPWLTRLRPTFWTLHTLNAFTGGCLYPFECTRYQNSCGKCPQFGRFPLHWLHRDGSRLIMYLRKWIYARSRLEIICVSDWLARQARKGILRRFFIHTIHNPVDTSIFYPIDKAQARRQLRIPLDARVVLFSVAANLQDTRKGFDIILEALNQLDIERLFLIPTAISSDSPELQAAMARFPSLPPQHLDSPEQLRLHYSAADVVWHPTRADTSSMVSLEALACGTPVIAARAGGVPEIVQNMENGLLIETDSPEALVTSTGKFFENGVLRGKLASSAKKSIMETHSLERFVLSHMTLYKGVEGESKNEEDQHG